MPQDQLTAKQERFVVVYFQCKSASDAYRAAYKVDKMKPATIHRSAHDVLQNHKVQARLQELKDSEVKTAATTVEQIRGTLNKALAIAERDEDSKAMALIAEKLAKLDGLWEERRVNTNHTHSYKHEDSKPDFEGKFIEARRKASKMLTHKDLSH